MVIEHGQIAEYGPKDKLLENKGIYYHMLKRQGEIYET